MGSLSPEPKWAVLCIEDDEFNARLIQRVMQMRPNITLLTAVTGEQGLRIAHESVPSLILLDRRLPDQQGADVLRRLKSATTTASIPVVVLSGDSGRNVVAEILELGAVQFISKPFDLDELLRVVDKFCGAAEPGG